MGGVADARRSGGEGAFAAGGGGGGAAEEGVQLRRDPRGGGQGRAVPGAPPAAPGRRAPARVVARRPAERHCKTPLTTQHDVKICAGNNK